MFFKVITRPSCFFTLCFVGLFCGVSLARTDTLKKMHPCSIPNSSAVKGRSDFSNCNFSQSLFEDAEIDKPANFSGSFFNQRANFDQFSVKDSFNFERSKFLKGFTMYRLVLTGAKFENSEF